MNLRRLLPARLLHDRRGVVAIEFGYTAILLLMFILGLLEFGRALWTQNVLGFAVEQAARYAIATPDANDTTLKKFTEDQLHNVEASKVTVTISRDVAGGVNFVTVKATTPFTSLAPFIQSGLFTLSSSTRVPLNS